MTDEIRASAPVTATETATARLYPFTASQWLELEQQTLAFKYIVSGMPVPPHLISTVIRSNVTSSSLFPYHQQQSPVGWGYFQLGYGRNIDPEPGRCRRTDGKKWRCSKEACPNSKYCEKHINRGKSKSKKKQMQPLNPTTNTSPTSATNTIPLMSCSVSPSYTTTSSTQMYPTELTHQGQDQGTAFYPFISLRSSSQQSSCSTMSDQNQHDLVWFMDPESHDDQPNKTIRFAF